MLDICASINGIRSLVYRRLVWVGVQKVNNYNPSHIVQRSSAGHRDAQHIFTHGVSRANTYMSIKVDYDTLYSRCRRLVVPAMPKDHRHRGLIQISRKTQKDLLRKIGDLRKE